MSNARNLADLLTPGENTLQTVAIETDRIILDGTDGSATNAGDDLLLDASAASTDVGERFTYEDGTDDASVVLNNLNTLAVTNNVTIGGDIDVTGSGAGAAGITSASSSGTAISIDSSNRVTMPAQPAFMAGPAAAQTNMANDTTIVLGTEVFDVGSNFASNTFTAPVTGKYQLNAAIRLQSVDSASTYVYLQINTANRDYYNVITVPRDHAAGPGFDLAYWNLSISVIADMDANDGAIMKFGYAGGTQQVDTSASGGTVFSGALIC